MTAKEMIGLRLDKDTAATLKTQAAERGITISDLCKARITQDHTELTALHTQVQMLQEQVKHLQGLQQKPPARRKKITVSLTNNEYYAYRMQAQKAGLTLSAFGRRLLSHAMATEHGMALPEPVSLQ